MNIQAMRRSLIPVAVLALTVPLGAANAVRIIQTNAAGDNTHVIDPVTNKVVGIIEDIEVPHGVTTAPDGSRIYITNEALSTVDFVDAKTLKVTKRVPLSGHPNNLSVSKDGKKVYAGIAQAPGAVDVIDTATMTNIKSIKVDGPIHNVYVTPDGKFAVSGSVATSVISVIDTKTDEIAWTVKLSSGIRPMTFDTKPDGSTNRIFVQLSNFHGFVAIDFATHKEVAKIELPEFPGEEKELEGIQGAPSHGLAVTPDGKTLLATSKWFGRLYTYSLPDLKYIGTVQTGSHPEWITLTPDGKTVYVADAGDDEVAAVDIKTLKVVARIKVGFVPKRNGTGILQTN